MMLAERAVAAAEFDRDADQTMPFLLHRSPAPAGAFNREIIRRIADAGLAVSAVAGAAGVPAALLDGRDAKRIPLGWVAAIATATRSDARSLKRIWAEEHEPALAARLVPQEANGIWFDALGPAGRCR
ncbi:hypothetical protein [Falsiroseomonas stagni]|uniref:hypothetical protein n=1 Tax=Falsiroseomonas stagni TaxID=484882 RepID=UPI000B851A17|nr:hypothetical protein [Falsiroseomonas stagni]MBX9593768.1 hypothetical protein [Roseomonas sp.]